LPEELVDLSTAAVHPLAITPADVLGHRTAEVLDYLEETAGMRVMRHEEAEKLFCLVQPLFEREEVVVVGEKRCAEDDSGIEDGVD
jgi:hypothetical protein